MLARLIGTGPTASKLIKEAVVAKLMMHLLQTLEPMEMHNLRDGNYTLVC